jgi:hypothetical protein
MELDARLQPHLGRVQDNYKPHQDANMLAIAKITKVHHKHGTVDLQLIKSNSVISSTPDNEGKYGARVLTASAHYDPALASSSGVIEPMQEGQLVLLAFMDGMKNQPIILGSFHQTWETEHNVLVDHYPLTPEDSITDKKEATKYLRVHPSQFYERIDGMGSKEVSHPSKTFMQIDPDLFGEMTDAHKGYDHHNLNERDPHTGQVRSANTEDAAYPVNVLFVHRSSYDDEVTTWTKMFINSSGMLRLTRDNNDGSLSFIQVSEDGAMKLRRQIDSPNHDEGENYSELSLEQTGEISLKRVVEGKSSDITIDEGGDIILSHKDGAYLKLTPDGLIGEGIGGGGGGTVVMVGAEEDPNWADGTFWIDTSDLEGV